MSTYLWINLLTIIVPLIASFHPKLAFYKKWYALFPAIIITAILFIVWDVYFTNLAVWGFTAEHVSTINIFNLPLEEVLFFIAIPYAIVFSYDSLKKFNVPKPSANSAKKIFLTAAVLLLILGLIYLGNLYTSFTFLATALFLLFHVFVLKSAYKGIFIVAYLIIFLFPFILVNGALTGSFHEVPVVWYNDLENMGIRVFTIPVEDFIYGMLLYLMNVTLFESFLKKS